MLTLVLVLAFFASGFMLMRHHHMLNSSGAVLLNENVYNNIWFIGVLAFVIFALLYAGIEWVLALGTLFSGLLFGFNRLVWAKCSEKKRESRPLINYIVVEVAEFFPILLVVWLLRSFAFQPYRVPTGSLEPTVLPGDFLLVSQYSYGLRMPLVHKKLVNIGEPQRGDIAVFYPPNDYSVYYIKRVIGLPGDHITYRNKHLYINGKQARQAVVGPAHPSDVPVPVIEKRENLGGVVHDVLVAPSIYGGMSQTWVVPPHHYFMMGDNRDFSNDSRFLGMIPEKNLVGKALFIWMSWDVNALMHHMWSKVVRWGRIGKKLV